MLLFGEDGAETAKVWIISDADIISSDFLSLEIGSVAAKKLRRGEIDRELADAAVRDGSRLVDRSVAVADHVSRAAQMAFDHGFSIYDATYLAIAEAMDCFVLTADARLVNRARNEGLERLVRLL